MEQRMKALNLVEPGRLRWEERPVPAPVPGHALLKIEAVGICGSDIHAFSGQQPYFSYPRVLGHEMSGRIVAAPPESGFAPDEQVAVIPYLPCGDCSGCRHERPNACTSMTILGVHTDGALAEYLNVPLSALIKISHLGLAPAQSAIIEPLAIGAHAARRTEARAGETALVCGAGPIGLAAAAFLRDRGAEVALAEVNSTRSDRVKTRFAYPVLNPAEESFSEQLTRFSGGEYADIVVDATGSKRSMDTSYRYIRSGGRIVFVGLFQGSFEIDDPYFHARESELRISRNATREDFDTVLDAIARKAVALDAYVSHTGPFSGLLEQLPEWIAGGADIFKAAALF